MTDHRIKKNERIKLAKKISLIAAGLFLFYVIIGFWVVPLLLKPKLEEQLSGLLGRKVTIAEIKFNPMVLSATTSDLTTREIDGQPFTGFEELYANCQLSSTVILPFPNQQSAHFRFCQNVDAPRTSLVPT